MQQADREKNSAAAASVLGAVLLTSLKFFVGVATGSLGILAEAAHSGLDLAAAVVTLVAVRVSGRPADRTHLYGHGKVENLSALFETLLLLATCAWIIHGAVRRLSTGAIEIEVGFWSFAVMGISIAVDVSRSRVLDRAARKFRSQALEADALHFRTDIWSSAVVILGLVCVKVGEWRPDIVFLRYADALAAMMVALLVVGVSARLGMRAIHALIDAAPLGLEERVVTAVEGVPGVFNCHQVRARYSGAQLFVDIHVLVDGRQTLQAAHDLTEEIERTIQQLVPEADVTVHPEPETANPPG